MGVRFVFSVSHASIALLLIVYFPLGYRELRHLRYYENDLMILRLLGLKHLPDVSTLSRQLADVDEYSVEQLKQTLPCTYIEMRMDSAFFSDRIISALDQARVEYSISVPFERFIQLKTMIEHRHRWYSLNQQQDYFESNWKPKSWHQSHRYIFVRYQVK
jgi:hypothetical protein